MSDLISREDAIKAVGDGHPLDYNGQAILYRIKALPTAERVGKWIEVENKWGGLEIRCSECGEEVPRDGWGIAMQSDYCPNCGARMTEGKEE